MKKNYKGIQIPDLPPANKEVAEVDLGKLPSQGSSGFAKFISQTQALVDEVHSGLKVIEANLKIDADLSVPAHSLMKQDNGREKIGQIKSKLVGKFGKDQVSTIGPFINVKVDKALLHRAISQEISEQKEKYGSNNSGQGKKVVIDTSSPNIAKQMHLGHLRSTVIGESLSRILRFNGYTVVRDNHVGDWGTQFGLLGRAVELWSDEVPELKSNKPDEQVKGLLKLYVRINQEIAEEKADGNEESELENAGREWFAKLEQGDKEARKFWEWAYKLSLLEFEQVYEILGVDFEYYLGESVYEPSLESVIKTYKEAGLTEVDDKGVVKVKPSTDRPDGLSIQKPDGASLYGTRDIATLAARLAWFDPVKILYVVDSRQGSYFSSLFDAFTQLAGDDVKDVEMKHVNFGEISLPEGSMSTRKGNVVFLVDVLNEFEKEAINRVKENMNSRGIDATAEEIKQIARQIAVGGLIYFDLHGSMARDIVYNPQQALSLEGNTGPALQYTLARMNAILQKASYGTDEIPIVDTDYEDYQKLDPEGSSLEDNLIFYISKFPLVVKESADKYEPSIISEYLYELSRHFNRFYGEKQILKTDNANLADVRLQLCAITRQVMRNGLSLLNIPMPERV